MSLNSNGSAVTRFTYDWLIRFAELHPFKLTEYFHKTELETANEKDNTQLPDNVEDFPKGAYDPRRSKYAAVSPLFTNLVTRYMPYLHYDDAFRIENDVIKKVIMPLWFHGHFPNVTLPLDKRCKVYVSTTCYFANLTPGVITSFKNNRVMFYADSLNFNFFNKRKSVSIITPDELKYLLNSRNYDNKVNIRASLTDQIMFSEIWPLLTHCKKVVLNIKNMIYDENLATVLWHGNQFNIEHLELSRVDISDSAVLQIFDSIFALPRPIVFYLTFLNEKSDLLLSTAINDKFNNAGIVNEAYRLPPWSFDQIEIIKRQGILCCSSSVDRNLTFID